MTTSEMRIGLTQKGKLFLSFYPRTSKYSFMKLVDRLCFEFESVRKAFSRHKLSKIILSVYMYINVLSFKSFYCFSFHDYKTLIVTTITVSLPS